MFGKLLMVVSLSIWPMVLHPSMGLTSDHLIVWNVGQGLWVTYIEHNTCHHFDSGGEISPIQKVIELCADRNNQHYLSHYDWDHMGFVASLKNRLRLCRVGEPYFDRRKKRKRAYLELPPCPEKLDSKIYELHITEGKKPNDNSRVFRLRGQILLPGDSPISKEKHWSKQISMPIHVLLLGHHGSKTSTGQDLLSRLAKNSTTIASARKARYGHPHHDVEAKIKKQGHALLRTEDWGNIWFSLP